jgi:hypothetical protein
MDVWWNELNWNEIGQYDDMKSENESRAIAEMIIAELNDFDWGTNQWINESMNQWINEWINLLICWRFHWKHNIEDSNFGYDDD